MVSKSQIKLITSLRQKKYRDQHKLFLAEGPKVIDELYRAGLKVHEIFSTQKLESFPNDMVTLVSENELKKISSLKTANTAVAIFNIPVFKKFEILGIIVALDDVRDPGNLGTIIRLCDWFGVEHLLCSKESVNCFNSKVIQASMGSLARVNVHYKDLENVFLENLSIPVYGAYLDGENVYGASLPKKAILLMGNEANGISPKMEKFVSNKISIPRFGALQQTESLNVATATAILLSEFHRSIEK